MASNPFEKDLKEVSESKETANPRNDFEFGGVKPNFEVCKSLRVTFGLDRALSGLAPSLPQQTPNKLEAGATDSFQSNGPLHCVAKPSGRIRKANGLCRNSNPK